MNRTGILGGEARLTAGPTAEEMCKQDQQVPAIAGGLQQERLKCAQ